MKSYPLPFSGPMVRALLNTKPGSWPAEPVDSSLPFKWQTRRILKPKPTGLPDGAYCDPYNGSYEHFTFWTSDNKMILGCGGNIPGTAHWNPKAKPGDRIWVRETWGHTMNTASPENWPNRPHLRTDGMPEDEAVIWRADGEWEWTDGDGWALEQRSFWKPSSNMPRWASRIELEVTGVRVERLWDISEADAKAEGSFLDRCPCIPRRKDKTPIEAAFQLEWCNIHGQEFKHLWQSIHGFESQDSGPWVVVREFRRVK